MMLKHHLTWLNFSQGNLMKSFRECKNISSPFNGRWLSLIVLLKKKSKQCHQSKEAYNSFCNCYQNLQQS